MNINEFMTELWCLWRTSKSSLLKDTFQNFFLLYSRIVTNWSSKYEMFSLVHVGHLGESSFFSSSLHGTDEILEDSLRIDQISEILKLLLIFKLSFLKLFGTAWIILPLHCLEQFELCFYCKYMYSTSYESIYNLAGKSFEIGLKKHMLFIKQYELLKKIPINGGWM